MNDFGKLLLLSRQPLYLHLYNVSGLYLLLSGSAPVARSHSLFLQNR